MSLMTWSDLQKPAVSDKSKKVYELVSSRVQDTTNPMPPASAGKLSSCQRRCGLRRQLGQCCDGTSSRGANA
jgi:hypothetical protein